VRATSKLRYEGAQLQTLASKDRRGRSKVEVPEGVLGLPDHELVGVRGREALSCSLLAVNLAVVEPPFGPRPDEAVTQLVPRCHPSRSGETVPSL
jgi:hypothetical protein